MIPVPKKAEVIPALDKKLVVEYLLWLINATTKMIKEK
jgi:hypothetical protein